MGTFNDRMKTMTASMRASATDRHEVVDRVLEEARTFIVQVNENHRAMATQLHQGLSSHRASLLDQVKEMRQDNQQSFRQMSQDLRERLTKDVERIEGEVGSYLDRCRGARHELAVDLKEAAETWRGHASGSDEPRPPRPAPNGPGTHRGRAAKTHRSTQEHTTRHGGEHGHH